MGRAPCNSRPRRDTCDGWGDPGWGVRRPCVAPQRLAAHAGGLPSWHAPCPYRPPVNQAPPVRKLGSRRTAMKIRTMFSLAVMAGGLAASAALAETHVNVSIGIGNAPPPPVVVV